MKRSNRGAVSLFVVLLVSACTTVSEPTVTPEQHELNLESFDMTWDIVNQTYWDPSFGGIDWRGVRDELRPRAEAARTMTEARLVIRDMVRRLGKSHFGIIPSEAYEEFDTEEGKYAGDTGLHLRVIDGAAVVFSVDEDSGARRLGIRPGWEVLAIGELNVRDELSELIEDVEESPRKIAILTGAVSSRMRGAIGGSVEVEFLDGDGRRVTLRLPLEKERGDTIMLGYLPPARVWIDVERLDENIGYIAFNAFVHPNVVMKGYNDAMTSFADADGIILDIRGNGGGMLDMMTGMAGWLVQEPREAGTIFMRGTELKLLLQPRATNYGGPVAILVDGLCASASEAFSGSLKEIGRAGIIGSRTMGAVLGARLEKLPNGDGLMYAAVNFVTASGEVLEGVGVEPDIEVHPTREALLEGRDPALEAAMDWIRRQRSRVADEQIRWR